MNMMKTAVAINLCSETLGTENFLTNHEYIIEDLYVAFGFRLERDNVKHETFKDR
jgi:hypothetical protein